MLQQLLVGNRFHTLAPDDPDNTDSDTDVTSRLTTEHPQEDPSSAGGDTEYFDVQEDAFYFQAKADQPPREPWNVANPLDFNDFNQTLYLIHQIHEGFQATKDISTPLGMDDAGQIWKWADVGSSQMPGRHQHTLHWQVEQVTINQRFQVESTTSNSRGSPTI